jgi:putative membrane-bound dehydrogenase-like protein
MNTFTPILTALSLVAATVAHAAEFSLHSFRKTRLNEHFWAEGASFGDFNRDGKMDIVAGPFWYAGPDFKTRHEYYPARQSFKRVGADGKEETLPGFEGALGTKNTYSDNFFAFVRDFNGDGWSDILIYGFPGKDASWFENPKGSDGPWKRHAIFEPVDNESPMFADINGDGKPEIVCNSGGFVGYAAQESSDPTQPWKFHAISPAGRWAKFTHGLGVGDVTGDGKVDVIEAGGVWEQPASLAGNPVWKKHPAVFGNGAQFYACDVNADGLPDVIGSLAAHGYGLAWWEQVREGGAITFRRHLIMGDKPEQNRYGVVFSQLHAIDLADMDGDGLKDIVVGKRFWAHGNHGDPEPNAPAVAYWFQLVRKGQDVDFVPHRIDDDSGVGTQLVTGDVNGDGLLDVLVANKKGAFVHLHEKKTVSEAEWAKAQPKANPAFAEFAGSVGAPAPAKPAPAQAAVADNNLPPRDTIKFAGLSPQEAAKAMTLPPGFRAQLFAAEPDVKQPVAFAIDDRGRLWVAEAYSYPIRQMEGQGKDRIVVFEDQDGDGAFDRRTVFMEGLNLVSGLEVGFGGVWVGAAPYLYFIPIADGDEPKPAGEPKILLDGWGYGDTHETMNTFLWGPDGWLYGCHGVFTHSVVGQPGTPEDARVKINAGIWRYHPTQHRFEVFAEGTSNPWGLDFNDHGHAIIEACVIPHLWHIIQGAHYQRQAGQHFNPHLYGNITTIADHAHYAGKTPHGGNNRSDSAGGGHAHAGLMVYLGGSWPAQYRGQAFMNNIHGARINMDILDPKGSGYVGKHGADFILFNDAWSQIVNLQYDQNGSVYLIDWYDKQQCHTRNPGDHDRANGRIFKVVYGDTKTTRVDLQKLPDDELVMLQLRKNEWLVRHARRILQERAVAGKVSAEARKKLRALLGLDGDVLKVKLSTEYHGVSSALGQLRVLWALHAIGGLSEADTLELLKHEDAQVRAWAIQVACENGQATDKLVKAFAELARTDASPVVRLYLASAVQRLALPQRWAIVAALHTHGEDAGDHNLPMMAWYALEPLAAVDFSRALQIAAESKLPRVLEFASRRGASLGTPEAFGALAGLLEKSSAEPQQLAILTGLSAALLGQRTAPLPAGWERVETRLATSANATIRSQTQGLSLTFGSASALTAAREMLSNKSANIESRQRALAALLNVKDAALPPLLLQLVNEPALRAAAIRGLAAFNEPKTPAALLAIYASLPENEKRDVLLTLVSRAAFAQPLLTALAENRVPVRDLSADIARQLRGLNQPDLTAQLEKVWGVTRETPADKLAAKEKYKLLIANSAMPKPDLSRGRALFAQTCAACHTLFGEGGKIGPDITGSNRADLDYLLHNILDPNAEIPNAYRTAMIELKDGRVVAGVANQQDPKVVSIVTPNETLTLPRSEIKALTMAEMSMMPEGLLSPWSERDVRDLIAYLRSPAQVPRPSGKSK